MNFKNRKNARILMNFKTANEFCCFILFRSVKLLTHYHIVRTTCNISQFNHRFFTDVNSTMFAWTQVTPRSLRLCVFGRRGRGLCVFGGLCVESKSSKTVKKSVKTTKMTIGVPIITCLHRVRRIHKAVR